MSYQDNTIHHQEDPDDGAVTGGMEREDHRETPPQVLIPDLDDDKETDAGLRDSGRTFSFLHQQEEPDLILRDDSGGIFSLLHQEDSDLIHRDDSGGIFSLSSNEATLGSGISSVSTVCSSSGSHSDEVTAAAAAPVRLYCKKTTQTQEDTDSNSASSPLRYDETLGSSINVFSPVCSSSDSHSDEVRGCLEPGTGCYARLGGVWYVADMLYQDCESILVLLTDRNEMHDVQTCDLRTHFRDIPAEDKVDRCLVEKLRRMGTWITSDRISQDKSDNTPSAASPSDIPNPVPSLQSR